MFANHPRCTCSFLFFTLLLSSIYFIGIWNNFLFIYLFNRKCTFQNGHCKFLRLLVQSEPLLCSFWIICYLFLPFVYKIIVFRIDKIFLVIYRVQLKNPGPLCLFFVYVWIFNFRYHYIYFFHQFPREPMCIFCSFLFSSL